MVKPTDYETVAASQTTQTLGPVGAVGDVLARLIVVPATVAPGAIAIKDGSGTAITVYAGTAAYDADLKTFVIELGLASAVGAWQVTTGANVSVIAVGRFT
jgi:hypothetical protein